MSNLKTYRVKAAWFDDAEVTLRVNHDILTPALATEINNFWSEADARLADEDEDVVRAVIRLFGAAAIRYMMDNGGASFSPVQKDWYWTKEVIRDQGEGWPDWESLGILIVGAAVSCVSYDDVTLEAA